MTSEPKINLVCIEGIIGAGKTTACSELEKIIEKSPELRNKKIVILKEPVEQWRQLGLLDHFYTDTKRWALTFQLTALVTKCIELLKLKNDTIYVIERSPYVDMLCFAKLCQNLGYINDMEMNIYKLYYDYFINELESRCTIRFIYIRTSVDTCINRISQRNRMEEKNIQREYLESLEKLHDEWLMTEKTLILDGDLDISNGKNIDNILHFIQ
jgi:deoxycitidine kinase/deoxyguanosine kinase